MKKRREKKVGGVKDVHMHYYELEYLARTIRQENKKDPNWKRNYLISRWYNSFKKKKKALTNPLKTLKNNKWIQQVCRIHYQCTKLILYSSNEQTENEIKETVLLKITSNRIWYLVINLNKEVFKQRLVHCKL